MEIRIDEEEGNIGERKRAKLVEKEKMQRRERWERIKNSKFNVWYQRVKGKGVSGYLKKSWREETWQDSD